MRLRDVDIQLHQAIHNSHSILCVSGMELQLDLVGSDLLELSFE